LLLFQFLAAKEGKGLRISSFLVRELGKPALQFLFAIDLDIPGRCNSNLYFSAARFDHGDRNALADHYLLAFLATQDQHVSTPLA
jgi:hypothetical protein